MNGNFRRPITAHEQAAIDASWDKVVAKLNNETALAAGGRLDATGDERDAGSRPDAAKRESTAASWDEVVAKINNETAAASGRRG
jgi:hypothetical protein